MVKYIGILLLILIGCASSVDNLVLMHSKKSYPELLNQYKSSKGKGLIDSRGTFNGKLSFSYKSQGDSTFFQFSDMVGRKTLLMWISPNTITIRDLINNKYYDNNQVVDIFPYLEILGTKDITKFVWGVEPDLRQKIKNLNKNMDNDLILKFSYTKLNNEKNALTSLDFSDRNSNNKLKIDIKKRERGTDHINMKKLWKMLEF
ncbi:MAG: hypothetical protein CMG55_05235 [Candidatus Marinimicrobia bacterium]|nr:hypothetical protein [Candidatus Neomarinimicrobiota bacterium]|tara:strand:- start:6741 stop:7349 length:609 start_codon:yes stop_codon:yes gene_type:complete